MKATDLRQLIKGSLGSLWSPAAEELLMATSAQESHLGQYRHQINGPALGIYQMEPGDHDDIWKNFLAYKPELAALAASASKDPAHPASEMQLNDAYATVMCRLHYMRCPRALPDPTDLNALWMYYKVNYNSVKGAATAVQFYANYHGYVGGDAR